MTKLNEQEGTLLINIYCSEPEEELQRIRKALATAFRWYGQSTEGSSKQDSEAIIVIANLLEKLA